MAENTPYPDSIDVSYSGTGTALFGTDASGGSNLQVTDFSINNGPTIEVPAGSMPSGSSFGDSGNGVGTYFDIAIDADGSINLTDDPDSQTLINAVNSNSGTSPLTDTIHYDVSGGADGVQGYTINLNLTDITLTGLSGPVTATGTTPVSLAGMDVSLPASSDGSGIADPTLTVVVTAYPTSAGGGGTLDFGASDSDPSVVADTSSGYSSFDLTGDQAQINADLQNLTFTGTGAGSSYVSMIATENDGVYQQTNPQDMADINSAIGNSVQYDEVITPNTSAYGGTLPDTVADGSASSSSATIVGISTDGTNFTAVPQDGSPVTISGNYESFQVDDQGNDSLILNESSQALANDINASSTPLTDTLYYEINDGSGNVSVDEVTWTYNDVDITAPSGTLNDAPGQSIEIPGVTVMKIPSTDGREISQDPQLTVQVGAFNFAAQAYGGTFAYLDQNGAVQSSPDADGQIAITGTQSQIAADLSHLTYTGAGTGDYALTVQTTDSTDGYQSAEYVYATIDVEQAACYLKGSLIRTPQGEVAIETLAIGDLVLTHSGAALPIRWVGRRSYQGTEARQRAVQPVCFRRGSLAPHVPTRDLRVSPEHAMLIDDMLIPAAALVNGATIVRESQVTEVDYYHLEFEQHAILYANGAAAESFVDDESRKMFDNAAEFVRLYPQAVRVPAQFCAPRVEEGEELERVRRRLARGIGQAA